MTKHVIQADKGAPPRGAYSHGWHNIEAILTAEGASLGDVVKVNAYLLDASLFPRYNAVYARRFGKPYPARTTVGSDLRVVPGMMIEIDAIAYVGER